jgi:ComF family protein
VLDALWDRLFPARCIGCGRRGQALCAPCRHELPLLSRSVCARCATTRPQRGVCRGCRQLSPQLTSIRAICAYQGAARKAVHTLKFRSGRYLAPLIGELMRDELARRPLRADLLVPVPMARDRMRDRGYNQAELLAHELAPGIGAPVVSGVLERASRMPQHTLGASERHDNLQGAITCVAPAEVIGRRILVIDDVCTTGATLSACAEALIDAGAARVSALVFARDL